MQIDPTNDMLRRLMVDAGLKPGMRVLDVGCGAGVVSKIIAELVGPSGSIVGIDRSAEALSLARRNLPSGEFRECDLLHLPPDLGVFDAAVGRRVLMYVPRKVEALQQIRSRLKEGGLLIFQEADATMTPASAAPMPLHKQIHDWVWETVKREGADLQMGFHLPQIFEDAGFTVEHIRVEGVVQTKTIERGGADLIRVMMPRILKEGVASEAEIDVETLDARLLAERQAARATYVGDMAFGVWGRRCS